MKFHVGLSSKLLQILISLIFSKAMDKFFPSSQLDTIIIFLLFKFNLLTVDI